MNSSTPATIDEYIASFPADVQNRLQQVRAAIRDVAPDAQETIKYAMPTFMLHGNLVYFAAFKNHIGFYATPTGHEAFKEELAAYKQGKGSVQFPLDQPLPLDLIRRITAHRVAKNTEKAFWTSLGAPARRAFEQQGITSLEDFTNFSETELLNLHGVGPGALPKIRQRLTAKGLALKENS